MKTSLLALTALFAVSLLLTILTVNGEHILRVKVNKGQRKTTKSGQSRLSRRFSQTKKTIPEPLKNADNFLYYGTISMGTPSQHVTVDFDTGSGDLWLPSASCSSSSCEMHKKFDSTSSSTFENGSETFSIRYGDGSRATGYTAYDTLTINGLEIARQGFALVSAEFGFESDPEDGMFGLAYQACSVTGFPTAIDNAYAQGLISQKVFAFYLNRDTDERVGGELIIGGIDSKHYSGDIIYTPVTEQVYWKFRMDKIRIKVGGETTTVCKNGCHAIADSGTSLIYGPAEDVDKLIGAIGADYDEAQESYVVDCNKTHEMPDLVFVIEGKKFPLKPNSYIYKYDGYCFISIVPDENASRWILGDTFMGVYYTIFDSTNSRVGFALAK